MSFSDKDRKFRADGGMSFPVDPSADVSATFANVIVDALRHDFGTSPAKVKHLARLTGSNPRTVQNWIYARNGPSGEGLVVLMRHSDAVTSAVLSLAGRLEIEHAVRSKVIRREARTAITKLLDYLGPD
jgi:hypothetical protein